MDNELVTTQKGIDKLPKPEIGFEFLQLPPQAENMRDEIEKSAGDALLILSEMGLQFPQKIPLTIVDESSYIDKFYDSTESYHKDLISFVQRLGQISLKKDSDGKWRDTIIMPLSNRFLGQSERAVLTASLAHELTHLWMFQETQFGKEIFPLREPIVQQKYKDESLNNKFVDDFGKISSTFHDIISDAEFRTLSHGESADVIIKSLPNLMTKVFNLYDIFTELFSQESTTDSYENGKLRVEFELLKQEDTLVLDRALQETIKKHMGEMIDGLGQEKEGMLKDEKLTMDVLIHSIEVERDNKLKALEIDKLFLKKGVSQFYSRMQKLVSKIEKGITVGEEVKKLAKDIFTTFENLTNFEQITEQYISEPRIISIDEIQHIDSLKLFIEGFSRFVEEKFFDEYGRRNPDVSTVLSYDKINTDYLPDLTNTKLLPYIKGLALFKSKYTTVREAMDTIRAMSIEQIQKEFLS